jgi:hypothetical protein
MKSAFFASSVLLLVGASASASAADDTVSTAVFSRIGNGYKREFQADGTPKTEYYAIANGGAVGGTMRDKTVEKVAFPDITKIAMPLLHRQGYDYAMDPKQATLLLVFHWGNTISANDINYQQGLASTGRAINALQELQRAGVTGSGLDPSLDALDFALMGLQMEEMTRNLVIAPNARLLGYIDDINDNNDMRRFVGGQRYNELRADVDETRYYLIISAYDFREVTDHGRQKLLWVTRVSVRTAGNSFDDSVAAMLKNSSPYFGQNTGKLIRGEELRGRVEMRDLKFLGPEATEPQPANDGKK